MMNVQTTKMHVTNVQTVQTHVQLLQRINPTSTQTTQTCTMMKLSNKQYKTHTTMKLHGQKQSWQKFKQDVTNYQDHKQDWSSLWISTLLVLKPAVLHPILQSTIPGKRGIR